MHTENPKKILEDMQESGELHLDEQRGTENDVRDPSFVHGFSLERSDNVTESFDAAFGVIRMTVMEYPLDEDGYLNQRDFEMEVRNTIRDILWQIGDEHRSNHARGIAAKKELLNALIIQFETDHTRVPKDTRPMFAAGYAREELRTLISEEYTAVDSREIRTNARAIPEGVRSILLRFDEMIRGFHRQDAGEELSAEEKELIHSSVDTFLYTAHEDNPEHLRHALRIMYEEQEEAMGEDIDGRWDEAFERLDAFCDTHQWKIGKNEDDEDFLV